MNNGPAKPKRGEAGLKGSETEAPATAFPVLDQSDLQRFLELKHSDPHHILGAHPSPHGITIRAFRPGAENVEVLIGRKRPQPLQQIHPAGVFDIHILGPAEIPNYRLRTHYPGGLVVDQRDPYCFLPTLGDLDLHLFGEGKHEAIYEKLGAHVRNVGGVRGVSFAVWAPQAEGVTMKAGTFTYATKAP